MRHFSEEELIAYQLGEGSDGIDVRRHVEVCVECAALSDSIAETLRVFSAEPVPVANFEHSWERVRGNLTVLEGKPQRFSWLKARWMWSAAGLLTAAALAFAVMLGVHVRRDGVQRNYALKSHQSFTAEPADPAIAGHLDAAERLLTEVNHATGPLDDATRTQAHALLLKNAVYVSGAHQQGDVAEATVLENLGRVLTTIDNEPSSSGSKLHGVRRGADDDAADGVGFRLEMNTSGLLLEIRILRQNDDRKQ